MNFDELPMIMETSDWIDMMIAQLQKQKTEIEQGGGDGYEI